MRRPFAKPLDWLVVSISIVVLFASRMYAQPEAVPAQLARAPLQSISTVPPTGGLFAYVREDGSQEFLPVANDMPSAMWEQEHAQQLAGVSLANADPRIAVFTWSSPVSAAEHPALQ